MIKVKLELSEAEEVYEALLKIETRNEDLIWYIKSLIDYEKEATQQESDEG
jgi:hypothetical protein